MSESIVEIVKRLEQAGFYGSLEVKFEAGVPVLIRKSETIKPTEPNYGNNRSQCHDRTQSR